MSSAAEVLSNGDTGVSVRQDFSGTEIMRGAETAMAAMAAQSKALVEARFVVAMRNRRNWLDIRTNVNRLCSDPGFAAEALYVKPLSGTPNDWASIDKRERLRRRIDGEVKDWPMGFSIRFIEAVLFECGNFDVDATIIWEDEDKRITLVSVIDLERNSAYKRTVTCAKTVERSYLKKGEEPITVRTNTNGQAVYVLPANTQQIETAEAAGVSKALRTMGERLLPPHFKAEWRKLIEATILNQAAKDPLAAKKVLLDNFAEKGVLPSSIEKYLEHSLDETQPEELATLRKIYVALANAEVNWRDVMEAKFGPGEDDKNKESAGAKKVKEALARKSPATAAATTVQQTSGAPAGPQPSPSGQPGSSASSVQPMPVKEPEQPTQPTQAPVAAAPPASGPPADLPHLEDWPDDLNQDWYWIGDVLFRWNEESGNYAKHSDRPFVQPAESKPEPAAAPRTANRTFSFPRRAQ